MLQLSKISGQSHDCHVGIASSNSLGRFDRVAMPAKRATSSRGSGPQPKRGRGRGHAAAARASDGPQLPGGPNNGYLAEVQAAVKDVLRHPLFSDMSAVGTVPIRDAEGGFLPTQRLFTLDIVTMPVKAVNVNTKKAKRLQYHFLSSPTRDFFAGQAMGVALGTNEQPEGASAM